MDSFGTTESKEKCKSMSWGNTATMATTQSLTALNFMNYFVNDETVDSEWAYQIYENKIK